MKKPKKKIRVLVCGSEFQQYLSSEFYESLEKIQDLGLNILLSDRPKGVEYNTAASLMVLYQYQNVTLCTPKDKFRIAWDKKWDRRHVRPPKNSSEEEEDIYLEREMARAASWALISYLPFSLDEEDNLLISKSPLRAAIMMLLDSRQVKICFSQNKEDQTIVLKSIEDLRQFIRSWRLHRTWPKPLLEQHTSKELCELLEGTLEDLIDAEQKAMDSLKDRTTARKYSE